MAYQAPAADMLFTLRHASGFAKAQGEGLYDLGDDLVEAILDEAGRVATEVVAPIDRAGDSTAPPAQQTPAEGPLEIRR